MKKFHSIIPSSAITLSQKTNIKILIAADKKEASFFFKVEEKDEFNEQRLIYQRLIDFLG